MIHHLLDRLFASYDRRFRLLRDRLACLDSPERPRQRSLVLGGTLLLCAAVTAFGFVPIDPDASEVTIAQVEEELALPNLDTQLANLDGGNQVYVHAERVRRGDTLGTLLTRMQVDDPAAENFVHATPAARAFYQLRPGRLILARTNSEGALLWLRYLRTRSDSGGDHDQESVSHSLILERTGADFQVREAIEQDESHIEMRSGSIQNSLFAATDAAGIPENIAMQITEIFAGDLDFYRDVRRGDQFRVVYEMFDQGGEAAPAGRVLAVEYVSGQHRHQAVWYRPAGQPGGYYGMGGESLRRAFLRTPLQFTRISSGFGGRVHPILKSWRWHTGIDYAAPIGTPVRATGDGTVVSAGWQTGYGNAVVIQHQGIYSTLYGHLSRLAPGLHAGQAVSQGQLIGFVGMTGWATGPHLHYEFRVRGLAKDPAHAALPDAPPVEKSQLAAFAAVTRDAHQQIDLLRSLDLAHAEGGSDGSGS
jgi:murein DD-endopeptidase MepM/ murein hydrolase activator NlpD